MIRPINIAFLTDSYWPSVGGIENAVHTLCNKLPEHISCAIHTQGAKTEHSSLIHPYWNTTSGPSTDPEGHSVTYIRAPAIKKCFLLPLLIWNTKGIKHFRSPHLFDSLYFWYRSAFKHTLQHLLKPYSLVHSFSTSWPARLATEICKEQGVALIHTPPIHFGRWGDSPAQLKAYTDGSAVTCFTTHFKNLLLQMVKTGNSTALHVIPPVITTCKADNSELPPVKGPFILFLGRREAHKGLPLLIDAYTKTESATRLVIAGPGQKVTTPNSSIVDLGEVSEPTKAALLNYCEFLAVPTRDESFGIVFTEAMSCGKPCVALDVPPVNEIIPDGKCGILVPPDDPAALSHALTTLMSNKELRILMGSNAKSRYDSIYSSDVTIAKIVDLYKSLLFTSIQSPQ